VRHRARVLVAVEASDELKLCVKLIRIVEVEVHEQEGPDDLVFEWFSMTGNSREDARRNCVESIEFYLFCRPELRDAILEALDTTTAEEVAIRLKGRTREEETTTRG
jgi:hypothetical protein